MSELGPVVGRRYQRLGGDKAPKIIPAVDESSGHGKTWKSRAISPLGPLTQGGIQELGHLHAQQGHQLLDCQQSIFIPNDGQHLSGRTVER